MPKSQVETTRAAAAFVPRRAGAAPSRPPHASIDADAPSREVLRKFLRLGMARSRVDESVPRHAGRESGAPYPWKRKNPAQDAGFQSCCTTLACRSGDGWLYGRCLGALRALGHFELHALAFLQAAEALGIDR